MKNFIQLSVILISFFSSLAFAEDSDLGPHQGQIKSAGAFLAEVVIHKDGSFYVYLLDPVTQVASKRYSYVTGSIEGPQGQNEVLCVAQKDYFECYPRGGNIRKAKKLNLKLARENVTGQDVVFNLPLFNPQDLKNAKARIQTLQIAKNSKFIVFRDGQRKSTTAVEPQDTGSFCALENLKSQNIKIKTTKRADLKIEKIEDSNEKSNRFSVLKNTNYFIYCDFTAETDFKMSALIEKINQHMTGFLRIL